MEAWNVYRDLWVQPVEKVSGGTIDYMFGDRLTKYSSKSMPLVLLEWVPRGVAMPLTWTSKGETAHVDFLESIVAFAGAFSD